MNPIGLRFFFICYFTNDQISKYIMFMIYGVFIKLTIIILFKRVRTKNAKVQYLNNNIIILLLTFLISLLQKAYLCRS